jgi:hypothetical protein
VDLPSSIDRRSAAIAQDVRDLIVRMGGENPRWGCMRIKGELAKLGITVSATAIRTVLRRHGLGPAPRRSGPTWFEFLRVQAKGIIAVDFFTVETAWLHTSTCSSLSSCGRGTFTWPQRHGIRTQRG